MHNARSLLPESIAAPSGPAIMRRIRSRPAKWPSIRKRIEQQEFSYESQRIRVTVSLGVSAIRRDFHLGVDIYKEADKALYESKRTGKNRVTVAAAALASD